MIFYKGKNYIPRDQDLRRDIVKMFHDHEMAGHPGELETYDSVKTHYWWLGMRMFVKNYYRDVVTVNNSRSTDPWPIPLTSLSLEPKPLAHLPTALWT